MKSFPKIAALLLGFLLSNLAYSESWISVTQDNNGKTIYGFDRDRLASVGELLAVWTLESSTEPLSRGRGVIDLFREQAYRRMSLLHVDCKSKAFVYVTVVTQNKEGRILDSFTEPENKRIPNSAPPGTAAEKLIDAACNHVAMQAIANKSNYSKNDPVEVAFIKTKWGYVGASADLSHEAYLGLDTVVVSDQTQPNFRTYLSRLDAKKPLMMKSRLTPHSVTRWLIDCSTLEMNQGNTAYFGSDGSFVDRILVPDLIEINPAKSTFAASIGKKACEASATVQENRSTEKVESPSTVPSISTGTAWYVGNVYFITASHVIGDAKEINGYWTINDWVVMKVIKNDPTNDVALLKSVSPVRLKPLQLAKSSVTVGARVFTLGYPHVGNLGIEPKFTGGEVSSLSGMLDDPRHLQISVPVQAGNSGGPLVNQSGEVVGVINSKLKADIVLKATGDLPQNVNYALKSWFVASMLDGLSLGGEPSRRTPKTQEDVAQMLRDSVVLILVK